MIETWIKINEDEGLICKMLKAWMELSNTGKMLAFTEFMDVACNPSNKKEQQNGSSGEDDDGYNDWS